MHLSRIMRMPLILALGTLPVWISAEVTEENPQDLISQETNFSTLISEDQLFQRVFWMPLEDTRIVHQHFEEVGEKQGRYFFVIRPNPRFQKRVWEENAFRLPSVETVQLDADAPSWFTPPLKDSPEMRSARDGSLVLIRDNASGVVYATGLIRGFAPEVTLPEPPKDVTPEEQAKSRLPRSSPPLPASE